MKKIECVGKDGMIRTFKYKVEEHPFRENREWIFRIYPISGYAADFFEFCVTEIDNNTVKVTMMHHNNQPEYIAKGIPERMIEEAHNVLKRRIISSTNSENHKILPNEYITISAVKVWKRLISNDLPPIKVPPVELDF